MLEDARHIALQQRRERFEMLLQSPDGLLRIFWTNGTTYTQHFAQPRRFISRDGFGITAAARAYLAPLIQGEAYPPFAGGLPRYPRFKHKLVPRRLKTRFDV